MKIYTSRKTSSLLVHSRVPPVSHRPNKIPRNKLKHLFLSAVEAALETGELPSRKHGWKAVFSKFIDLMGPDCSWYPSHAEVARKAKVSERTAWAAINALESIGLIRVEARYIYDHEKSKTVRTSNLYEVVVTKAQRAIAILAGTARKAKEAAKRQWAAASRSSMLEWGRRVIHHLPATAAEDPQLNIFKKGNQAEPIRNWSHNEWLEYCQRGNPTS
ncbi:hypothetical protein GOB86_08085 [Acetobacter lambici]|uniref:Helix-turn-helix domain-containing protein n=1 Tax=Acetobacter lambici TaxID=1332824 RepID=A0ABT1F0T8_9PROT|nr:hypothetical protein [Acetobacter lambici]MCP1242589.1 hypothetical protein [Acetobacter lambici]MCP1258810.1 hypothetical protein [Acetobacter lambici]NHO57018.1 hypothetical protein [Acetobacter lambici]